jgi:hypothetical protein
LLGSLVRKGNEQQRTHLAQRTSNCGNWTTWGQMTASWKRTRLGKQQVAASGLLKALNTVVELARARTPQSCMTRVMQSRACIAYSRTCDYCRTAARGDPLIARSCMSEASSRARGVRACVPYCRIALYGFPTAKCDNLLVWRREMRSEGVANRPNGQQFWDQETSLCLLQLPTVLQRPC